MFCGLLGIRPAPNNGSLTSVCQMLSDKSTCLNPNRPNDSAQALGGRVELQALSVLFAVIAIFVPLGF